MFVSIAENISFTFVPMAQNISFMFVSIFWNISLLFRLKLLFLCLELKVVSMLEMMSLFHLLCSFNMLWLHHIIHKTACFFGRLLLFNKYLICVHDG